MLSPGCAAYSENRATSWSRERNALLARAWREQIRSCPPHSLARTQRESLQVCLEDFEGWHDDVATLIKAIDAHYKWALMVREPIANWTVGASTLLGDAAHPTLPFLAQGAAMEIEDGVVLARALAQDPTDTPKALSAYRYARIDRTSRIVRGSFENALRFHNPLLADAQGAEQYVTQQWQPERIEQYGGLFSYRAEEVGVA